MPDFQKVKASVSLTDAISKLGLEGKHHGNQWRGKCPGCGSDDDRKLVITEGKGAYCFGVEAGGDVIWLAAHVRGLTKNGKPDFKAAALWLTGNSTSSVPNSTVTVKSQEPRQEVRDSALIPTGADCYYGPRNGAGNTFDSAQ